MLDMRRVKRHACLKQDQNEQQSDSTDAQNPLHSPNGTTYQTQL